MHWSDRLMIKQVQLFLHRTKEFVPSAAVSYCGQSPRKKTENCVLYNEHTYCNTLMEVFFFLILDCEAISTAATPGLLCQPRVIVVKMMFVEKQMECRLAGETEVLGENLPQRRHFCPSQNPT
jgi:hypothetical protein